MGEPRAGLASKVGSAIGLRVRILFHYKERVMSRFLPLIVSAAFLLASCSGHDQSSHSIASAASPAAPSSSPVATAAQTLEAGCATCVFGMEDVKGCQLAVKLDDKPYLVSGVEMPGHESGLCDHSRTAELTGHLDGERFIATSFALKP